MEIGKVDGDDDDVQEKNVMKMNTDVESGQVGEELPMMATASITIDTGREPVLPVGTNRFEYYQAVWHSQPPVYPSSYTTASVLTAVFCSIPYGVYALAATRQAQRAACSGRQSEAQRHSKRARQLICTGIFIGTVIHALALAVLLILLI